MSALPDTMPLKQQYKTLKAQLAQGTDLSALESDVYSALYNFFSRYYDEGDFISKRRYKEGVYAIPYEGEEVKLYWANQDQYYIKTSENFKDYTFISGDYTVHFLLVDATTEQNNNKETADNKRQFMLFTENEETYPGLKTFEYDEVTKTVNIRFLFDIPADKKAKYQELNAAAIKQWLSTQNSNLMMELLRPANPEAKAKDQISVVEKHLKAYVAKNSFDYFIHKDLGAFLNRELDFFIKNEVMHLDDLDTENEARVETYIAKVRAIKQVGRVIISFLAQLENFQKKLWLKKKFVVETNWCITLDRIPEKYYDEIRQNKAQVQEWVEMYAINELQTDLEHTEPFTDVPSVLFLKQNQYLVVDTKHFGEEFKQRLLASIDNLDEQCDGLLINSENFQALELLQEKYKGKIRCTYIDPPYNTGSDNPFLYKDCYQHSSWLSMMCDRTILNYRLSDELGCYYISTDDGEYAQLKTMLESVYSEKNFVADVIWNSRKSVSNDAILSGAINHTTFYVKDKDILTKSKNKFRIGGAVSGFSNPDNDPLGDWKIDPMDAPGIRENLSYGITNPKTGQTFYPPQGRHWRFEEKYTLKYLEEGRIVFGRSGDAKPGFKRYLFEAEEKGLTMTTLWDDVKATTEATNMLLDIFGESLPKVVIDKIKPKPVELVNRIVELSCEDNNVVIDYFAGSGTTGHAVIDRTRNTQLTNLKYILCDMGWYFKDLLKPRIKKVIYSKDWKDGKPVSREGSSHCFKYLRLEQYEDALNNIQLQRNEGLSSLFGDDYLINYMLDFEAKGSLLNLQAFKTPFSYEMKITEKNEAKTQRVDLCETFNYLIGLRVTHQSVIRCYDSKPADTPDYEGAVDLEKGTQHAFRQIEGTLPDGRKALVIWRTIGDDLQASNSALDAYFERYRINPLDREYDVIYVNGDNNLENLRTSEETWKVVLIEQEFNKRMFAEE